MATRIKVICGLGHYNLYCWQ